MFASWSILRCINSRAALTDLGTGRAGLGRALQAPHSLIWSSTRFIDKYSSNFIGAIAFVRAGEARRGQVENSDVHLRGRLTAT